MKQIQKICALGLLASIALAPAPVHSITFNPFLVVQDVWKNINESCRKAYRWDWETIETDHVDGIPVAEIFAQQIKNLKNKNDNHTAWLWGAATSAHQVEGGCTNNNWYEWSQLPEQQAKGMVDAGKACDFWNKYPEIIKDLKATGADTLRLSIEWSKVMPTADTFDEAALNHYEKIFKECKAQGIKPIVTLFHYTEPLWFYHDGSWEKKENVEHFVRFAEKVFERFHPYVHLWLTFNSPSGHAFQGWHIGTKPPAKKGELQLVGQVLGNMMEAHAQVYERLKKMKGGLESRIGLLKNIFQLDPWDACNPLDHLACKMGNYMQNECIYTFLKTGEFSFYVPGKASVKHTNEYIKNGGKCLDFIGLNYYCHGYMKNFKTIRDEENEIITNSPNYTIYGEGLYRAIKDLSDAIATPCNVPIYITENGISSNNEKDRTTFDKRYMYALAKAINDGYDVRGYTRWALLDNYEWGSFEKRYGLYHVDFKTLKRTLRESALYLVSLIKTSKQLAQKMENESELKAYQKPKSEVHKLSKLQTHAAAPAA